MPKRAGYEQMSDAQLVEAYKSSGNTELVQALTQRYAQHIMSFGWKQIGNADAVQDFAQDVFTKLCEKLKTQNVEQFKSWLYTFMRNLTIDAGRRQQLFEGYANQQHKSGIATLQFVETELDMKHLRTALDDLSEKERTCMVLLYFQDLSYAEIMEETGLSFNQIRGIKDRTLVKLRERLSNIYNDRRNKQA
ncbi:MAG: sigma-70 family RNA polymerase sigma factor [Bacteroidetes bacterium]|nr:sigma-70 family RNA polymerase sigma factor [Bacteroidota bacterium]